MPTREAVIVSTARTPIGKAYRGAFNATPSPTLAAFAIRAAVERAGIDPAEVDDVHHGRRAPAGRADDDRPHRRRSAPAFRSPSPACRSTGNARRA